MPRLNPDKGDVAAVVKGNNEFAFDLYGQLRKQNGNLFFSPNSISTALAMTYAGARNDTAAEMAKALHFTLPEDKLHPAFADLVRDSTARAKSAATSSASPTPSGANPGSASRRTSSS